MHGGRAVDQGLEIFAVDAPAFPLTEYPQASESDVDEWFAAADMLYRLRVDRAGKG